MVYALVIVSIGLVGCLFFGLLQYRKAMALRRRYSRIADEDDEVLRLKKEQEALEAESSAMKARIGETRTLWDVEFSKTVNELEKLSKEVDTLRDVSEMQDFGLYEPIFAFEDSERYKAKVKDVRSQQKFLIKHGHAAVCDTEWTVEGSAAKGRKMVAKYIKLLLRAFNGESDSAISKARFDNVVKLRERIEKTFVALNKLGETNQIRITQEYLSLKLDELHLAYELAQQKQKEKEEQAEIKAQMREEEAARKEIEKAQKVAEKEEATYQKALEAARKELAEANESKQDALRKKIALLEKQFEDAHEQKARAISRAQLTKSGHVYVISNIGSFGNDVFKIGMTRRLEPVDRVRELGDASVPFRFDIHAMIYSDDAPALESNLHKHFASREMNRINTRREFYRVTLDEIEEAVSKLAGPDVDFVRTAIAEEFRQSEAIRRKELEAEAKRTRAAEDARVAGAKLKLEELRKGWKAEPVG